MPSPPDEQDGRPRPGSARPKMVARSGCTRDQYARWCCRQPAPCTFGLTDEELGREAARLFREGWSVDEIRAVLDLPTVIT